MSQTAAGITLQIKAAEDPSVLNKFLRSSGLTATDSKQFGEMLDLAQAQDWQGVLTAYHGLATEMKQTKICLMIRLNAAMNLQFEKEITTTFEAIQKLVGDKSGIDLISLDYFFYRREFDNAFAAVERLEQTVGGDPYLDFVRAGISLAANDYDNAIIAARRAAKREPSLFQTHLLIAKASQAKGDFKMVAEEMKKLESLGRATPSELLDSPNFAPFVASPEFQAWKAESQAASEAKK